MAKRSNDRELMELAVAEMRKSRSEHTDKADPLVGAVLVDAEGNRLAEAHRGRLREGDHAEYTLIERILGGTDLKGATLYVTLEPCTKRSADKTPCARRVVQARIARVLIGTPDPNPVIEGTGIAYLLNNKVEVEFFDQDLVDKIRAENADFIEYYAHPDEATAAESAELPTPSLKEAEPLPAADLADLSRECIRDFVEEVGKPVVTGSAEQWTWFEKRGYVTQVEGRQVPTVAGLTLFGSQPHDVMPQCLVLLEARDSAGRTFTDEASGPLFSIPEKVASFLVAHMRQVVEIHGMKREKKPEFPIEAIREAVVNAIVHRSYEGGARVQVVVGPGKLVVRSPGIPIEPLTLERLRNFDAPAFSRNPRIAAALREMKLMEERGWGLRRMRELLQAVRLPPPTFDVDAGYFVVTFRAPGVDMPPRPAESVDELTLRQRKLMDFAQEKGKVTAREAAKTLDVSIRTARAALSDLVEAGLLVRRGGGPYTHYRPKD